MEIERSSSDIINLDLAGIGKGKVCGFLSCGKVPYIHLFPFQKTKKKKRSVGQSWNKGVTPEPKILVKNCPVSIVGRFVLHQTNDKNSTETGSPNGNCQQKMSFKLKQELGTGMWERQQ